MKLLITILGILIGVGVIFLISSFFIQDFVGLRAISSAMVSVLPGGKTTFEVADDCGIMFGRVLHSIKNEETCAQKCRVKCQVEQLDYESSSFALDINACNKCTCVCK